MVVIFTFDQIQVITTMSNLRKLNKPQFAVFSDLHLGKHNNSAKWHQIAYNWADWIVASLKQNNIKDVIFCGDWHDNRSEISTHTLDVSAKILSKFDDFNIYMIVGNHDIPYKNDTSVSSVSIYSGKDNVTVIDKPGVIECFDRKIQLTPWATQIDDIVKSDIILGHFEINSFKMNGNHVCEGGLHPIELLDRTKLLFSGHFHVRSSRRYSGGEIIYTGNPFEMDFGDEKDIKGYYIVDVDTLEYRFVENSVSPKHKTLRISKLCNLDVDQIRKEVTGNIVKVIFDLKIGADDSRYVVEKLSSWKPESILAEYSFIEDAIIGDLDCDQVSVIDPKTAFENFIEAMEVDNKLKIKEYILDLYSRYE